MALKPSRIRRGILALAALTIVTVGITVVSQNSTSLAMEVDNFLRANGVNVTPRILGEDYAVNCTPENRYYISACVIVVKAGYASGLGLASIDPELNRYLYLLYESSISEVVRGIGLWGTNPLRWVGGVREPDSDTTYQFVIVLEVYKIS